jgi:hypothetical protein
MRSSPQSGTAAQPDVVDRQRAADGCNLSGRQARVTAGASPNAVITLPAAAFG